MSSPVTPSVVNFIQAQPFVLAGSGSSIGDTTITLQSMIGIDGNNIVTADLGSFAYGTLEPGNGAQEEAILFTGVTQNSNGTATLTGVSSIGFKQPYTVTTGVQKTHAGASKFILSNDAAFYNNFTLYLNAIAGAGAANASTAVKGIVQAATASQINSGTPTGSTGAVLAVTPDALATSNYALASGTAAALAGTSGTPSATNKFVTQASLKFGGTGALGALTISSGTTTINLSNAAITELNYTSISITGTGQLAFSNPNSNGSIVIIKSQGNVTFSSSATPCIAGTAIGAAGGANGNTNFVIQTLKGNNGTNGTGSTPGSGGAGVNPTGNALYLTKILALATGAGGGTGGSQGGSAAGGGGGGGASSSNGGGSGVTGNLSGSAASGHAGGIGGGSILIECAGTYNNSSNHSVAGGAGVTSADAGGAGGGGAGGTFIVLYGTLGTDSGSYTVTGGTAGTASGQGGAGGAGGNGVSYIGPNTEFN